METFARDADVKGSRRDEGRQLMCPKCHSHDLLQVILRPADEAVPFTTCRHCEHHWWGQAGQTIALDEVLARLA